MPKRVVTKSELKQFTRDHLEVDSKDIEGPFNYVGVFRCRVIQNGQEVLNKWVEINSGTGNLGKGNMKDLEDQTTVISNGLCITYSFYDAPGKGNLAGLPYWDQFYVSVSPNHISWMSSVAPIGSSVASKPFSRFVLPAAHDVGMNSLQNSILCLQRAGAEFFNVLSGGVKAVEMLPISSNELKMEFLPNLIQSLAITQKDTLKTILTCGARYFEFRPAYVHDAIRKLQPIPDILYFTHGPIPGMAYEQFLADCVEFLIHNPGEIIVCQLRWDGVPPQCARPSKQDLGNYLSQALKSANGAIQVGTLDDMNKLTIEQLRTQHKRLIIFQDVNSFSTYTDQGNATLTGDSIIAEFQKLSADNQKAHAFTNLQCQATATNIKQIFLSALSANASNSWLLCTKAICDNKTMPWIRANALARLTAEQLIVIMDDFVDGGMCDLARDLSIQRLNK